MSLLRNGSVTAPFGNRQPEAGYRYLSIPLVLESASWRGDRPADPLSKINRLVRTGGTFATMARRLVGFMNRGPLSLRRCRTRWSVRGFTSRIGSHAVATIATACRDLSLAFVGMTGQAWFGVSG